MNDDTRPTTSSETPVDHWSTSPSLLQRARDKDSDAWQRIVQLYAPLVVHWCRKATLPASDIDDVVQDIFLSVSRELSGFRLDRPGGTFRGWLRVITRRRIADHFRRHSDRPIAEGGTTALRRLHDARDPLAEEFEDGLASDDDAESEEGDLAHRALELIRHQFQPNTWQAFWRTAIDGAQPADLADELQMSQSAIRMARSRVLARLRQEMDGLL
jgi:RNA polymerase sigma-70 factor (ECF subfamily)